MIIGLVLGTLSYRAAYAAIFDFRYNHIPLPPFTIRTQFSYDQHPRFDDTGNLTEGIAEDDHLMMWSWWKHTGIQDKEREKERSWLRCIRSVKTTERELAHIFEPSKQKIIVEGAEDQGLENDSWGTLDGKIDANCKRSDCEKDE
jgi:diacylglycerol diphosphate phosphatase / phosphatidate phosphatase